MDVNWKHVGQDLLMLAGVFLVISSLVFWKVAL